MLDACRVVLCRGLSAELCSAREMYLHYDWADLIDGSQPLLVPLESLGRARKVTGSKARLIRGYKPSVMPVWEIKKHY